MSRLKKRKMKQKEERKKRKGGTVNIVHVSVKASPACRRTRLMPAFRGSTGRHVEHRRLVGPPGFHTTAREPKRAHFRVPALRNTTKIPREDPQRGKKRTKMGSGRGKKKREISGGPAEGCPAEGCPAEGGSSGGVQRKV